MRCVKSCVCLFVFFSRSFCEWLRKQVSTLNQSSRQNLLMGRRRQEQGNKLKNQRQVQTAALRLALAGMYMHVQQPFCIFIFKRVLPKCCQGGKDNPNEVVSDHYFLSLKSNVIFVFKLKWTLCVYIFLVLILALKVMFACCLQNLWRQILSVATAEVVSQPPAGGWPGSSSGLSSSSVGFMPAEAAGAS